MAATAEELALIQLLVDQVASLKSVLVSLTYTVLPASGPYDTKENANSFEAINTEIDALEKRELEITISSVNLQGR
jgi:hypothetical protein